MDERQGAGNGETYSGDKARQGDIILRTRTRLFVFFGLPILIVIGVLVIAAT